MAAAYFRWRSRKVVRRAENAERRLGSLGSLTVSQPWPAPAGSRTNETTPARARGAGLHLGNGAVAVTGGVGDEQRCSYPGDGVVRGEPVAKFEIEESGGERDAAPDIDDGAGSDSDGAPGGGTDHGDVPGTGAAQGGDGGGHVGGVPVALLAGGAAGVAGAAAVEQQTWNPRPAR